MRDVAGARPLGTAIAGVVGCQLGPAPSWGDEWYEQGAGEEPPLLMASWLTAAAEPYRLSMSGHP